MKVSRIQALSAAVIAAALMVGCSQDKAGVAKSEEPIPSCEDIAMGKTPVPQPVAGGVHYGGAFKVAEAETLPVTKVLADPAAYNNKVLRLSGKVTDVCAKKGCWLTFGDKKSEQDVFVKFVDPSEGKLVPVKATGHAIVAEGTFKMSTISEAFARELVMDSGGTREEAMKIVGPQKKLILMNPAVTISGLQ